MLLSIDPGREKVGTAVLTAEGKVKYKQVLPVAEIEKQVEKLQHTNQITQLILGNGTNSEGIKEKLTSYFEQIIEVEEAYSTLEARKYYWQENPPQGWRKLLPLSLQTPPQPIDDYVAVILGRRYLEEQE